MYYTSHHHVLCGLCEQYEVERAQAERNNFKYQLEIYMKKLDTLQQEKEKAAIDYQVSESGFSPFQTSIICFHLSILELRELLCFHLHLWSRCDMISAN
jgi:hypothetical protein